MAAVLLSQRLNFLNISKFFVKKPLQKTAKMQRIAYILVKKEANFQKGIDLSRYIYYYINASGGQLPFYK